MNDTDEPVTAGRPTLKHLILVPTGGLCNRLRAIASARRLAKQLKSRLSLVWEWGEFQEFFVPIPEIEIVQRAPDLGQKVIHHQPFRVARSHRRTIDVFSEIVEVHSGYIFYGNHERPSRLLSVIADDIPAPAGSVSARIETFSRERFQRTVGFHLRRTDHEMANRCSPDHLFISLGTTLVAEGRSLFLATDNEETRGKMARHFGQHLVVYPRSGIYENWPRGYHRVGLEDDIIDLFLLARTDYVVGSHGSSFSQVAIALNRSAKSFFLRLPQLMDSGG
jgi:hypothetical protein